ncbi:40S ribosomal protein S13 [Glycine soja]
MEVEGSSKKTIVMQQKEIAEARVPLSYRDQCAHLLIPLNRCSKNVPSFKWYNVEEEILEKKMKIGADPFGAPTKYWPWEDVRANFEFISKLSVDFWCFHDKDIAYEGKTLVDQRPMLEIPEDLYHLIKNAVSIRNHLERNKKEKDSKFRLILVDSRIHRLARYYNKTKELPQLRHDEEVVVNCFDECSNKTREKEERGVTWMWRRKLLLRVL